MMKKPYQSAATWCIVLFLCGIASMPRSASAHEPVTFLYTTWKPYVYEEDGHVQGIAVERVRAVCAKAGCIPHFVNKPWPWVLQALRTGTGGDAVFTALQTQKRKEFMEFSTEPLGMARNIILGCRQDAGVIEELDDLAGALVGVVKGYAYEEEFSNATHFTRDNSPSDEVLLRKCLGGRLDYAIINETVFKSMATSTPGALSLNVQPYEAEHSPFYIAFSKSLGKKASRWALQISDAIWTMRRNGELPPLPQDALD